MTDMIERGAEAMKAKRRELIAQPLDRIWPDLMQAAITAMADLIVARSDGKRYRIIHDESGNTAFVEWELPDTATMVTTSTLVPHDGEKP